MIEEYLQDLPRKRMASGVLFVNCVNEILIVKTTYKEGWNLPGGVIEENESPLEACSREVSEELGVSGQNYKLLCIDYTLPTEGRNESLQFVFFGGILSQDQINSIILPPDELEEFAFKPIQEAIALLHPRIQKRAEESFNALIKNEVVYLEEGVRKYD